MSHMVKGTTNFSVDNKDILIEALKEAYDGCEVHENIQMSGYGRQQCDIVVKRKSGRDIGFRKQKDGNYEAMCYEPGYGGDAVQRALKPVYEPYGKGVARDMMKRNPNLRNFRMGKTKEVERNGKKMKRIRLQQAGRWILMAAPQYIDFFIDPETGEMEIKIEGFPDAVCDAMAAEILKNLGMTDAKVTKTGSFEGGDGQTRTQSIS